MSGRKRPARHDPSDPMHWNKEQYIHHLKEMGISVKSTWRLDMIRQLYFENYKNTPQSEGEVPQDTININDNTSTEPSKEQNEMETQVQQTNQNSCATHTEELLKETTCALKTAREALSSCLQWWQEFFKTRVLLVVLQIRSRTSMYRRLSKQLTEQLLL